MGTFHQGLGDLHGITVYIETTDGTIYIGRCHEATDDYVDLLKYDTAPALEEGDSARQAWIDKAKSNGVFAKHKSIRLPQAAIKTIAPLGQI